MSRKRINLALGFHNHQPVGNFDWVMEDAWKQAYFPFLQCLERHPSIRVNLHFTGPLWDEYQVTHPEWIDMIRTLVGRGQVEMLSGGYYEPILVNISDVDKLAQIKRLNRKIHRETGVRPKGMWCAERVWEPSLAKPISLADIQYTVLDESHFRYAGLEEEDVFGYYVTEEQGHPLKVVPINYNLRQMIPFDSPEKVIAYLERWADESGKRLAVFADDGEKFGVWPETHRIVWEEKWMDRFFTLLEENSDWIKTTTLGDYLDNNLPLGRIYLPTASYFEMGTWALPTKETRQLYHILDEIRAEGKWDRNRNFFRGGFWRNFLVKYHESNRIQKKALLVSEKVHSMVSKERIDAEEDLYKGQCNCAYWHGLFGGIYLPHLRHTIQEHLIRAEDYADNAVHRGEPYREVYMIDADRDMSEEAIINTSNLQLSLDPLRGGALYELDYKPVAVNVCDTITRRDEPYHDEVRYLANREREVGSEKANLPKAWERDLDKHLAYDSYRRYSFIDHFLEREATLDDLYFGNHQELGDFVEKPYGTAATTLDDKVVLKMSREGRVIEGVESRTLRVEKTFVTGASESTFFVKYRIINTSGKPVKLNYGCELNLSFLSKDLETNYIMIEREREKDGEPYRETERYALTSRKTHEKLEKIALRDGHRGYRINLDFGMEADVWHFPIETVSKSEAGFERVYQSTMVMPIYEISLGIDEAWDNTIEFGLEEVNTYENESTIEIPSEELDMAKEDEEDEDGVAA